MKNKLIKKIINKIEVQQKFYARVRDSKGYTKLDISHDPDLRYPTYRDKFDNNFKDISKWDTYYEGYLSALTHIQPHIKAIIKESYVDENAETLNDKLRMEHTPVPEEREDAIKFHTFKEMVEDDRPTPKV